MGHLAKDCPEEKKPKDSRGGSSGGFTMMCAESPVEEEFTHHTEQLNLEVNLEIIKDLEEDLEPQLE